MTTSKDEFPVETAGDDAIDGYRFEEFLEAAEQFHGYPAPGLILGAMMVTAAIRRLPAGILYDAICETPWCLPDAVQMLTPCTVGNGWLRVLNLGRYAVSLFDKFTGEGVRVYLDPARLSAWEDVQDWFMKRKPKHEQCSDRIREQIRTCGPRMFRVETVRVRGAVLVKRDKGAIAVCPACGEAYPGLHGDRCRGCRGSSPYDALDGGRPETAAVEMPALEAVPVADAVGKTLLHDMTRIVPGQSKGPAFRRGQVVSAGDVCRLQQMGRRTLYVTESAAASNGFVHEDAAALAFGRAMAGAGTRPAESPREGKLSLNAAISGLLVVDVERLEQFNLVPDVMAAGLKSYSIVSAGDTIAGTRAIPLFLGAGRFDSAMALLAGGPLFRVLPIPPARIGILVTGTEVFQGLVQDRFEAVVTEKVRRYGCTIAKAIIVPDDRQAIAAGIAGLLAAGSQVVITTAGLSVDPDDMTRKGLLDAGAADMLYGAAVLPGAMTLTARIGDVRLVGVPACALFHRTTAFDRLLPRVLAGVDITRKDLARLGHGGLCMDCATCTFPKCAFGG